MKLVIENVAPGGPAHTAIIDGKSYPVISCTPDGDGMTETYELEGEPTTPVINVTVQQPTVSTQELAERVVRYVKLNRLGH